MRQLAIVLLLAACKSSPPVPPPPCEPIPGWLVFDQTVDGVDRWGPPVVDGAAQRPEGEPWTVVHVRDGCVVWSVDWE